jgi:hypothetical protein
MEERIRRLEQPSLPVSKDERTPSSHRQHGFGGDEEALDQLEERLSDLEGHVGDGAR